jgi:putative protein kinase ArgK-like GTPase of G3E family
VIGIADTVGARADARLGRLDPGAEGRDHGDPDVIAINKSDDPGGEDDAERGALGPRARHDAGWKPPIVLPEAMRGEHVPGARGSRSRSTGAYLESMGLLEAARRENLAGEVASVASSRAKGTSSAR